MKNSMTEANKILEMIENVSPDDANSDWLSAPLFDINALVFRYVVREGRGTGDYEVLRKELVGVGGVPKYTTSLDASKAIRLDGFIPIGEFPKSHKEGESCTGFAAIEYYKSGKCSLLPTEELAVLWAIIYERKTA